jgi:nitroreductase
MGLLDLARYAPSGSNRQPVEWLVVYDRAKVKAFAKTALAWLRTSPLATDYARSFALAAEKDLDVVCRGAPHMVIAHTPKGRETDGVIAVAHLELAAYAHGFGACWGGFANFAINGSVDVRQLIQFPEGRTSSGVMLLGYPRHQHERIPQRNALRAEWR